MREQRGHCRREVIRFTITGKRDIEVDRDEGMGAALLQYPVQELRLGQRARIAIQQKAR